eukprot:1192860-Prorocentrum_minimum.AAC.1
MCKTDTLLRTSANSTMISTGVLGMCASSWRTFSNLRRDRYVHIRGIGGHQCCWAYTSGGGAVTIQLMYQFYRPGHSVGGGLEE